MIQRVGKQFPLHRVDLGMCQCGHREYVALNPMTKYLRWKLGLFMFMLWFVFPEINSFDTLPCLKSQGILINSFLCLEVGSRALKNKPKTVFFSCFSWKVVGTIVLPWTITGWDSMYTFIYITIYIHIMFEIIADGLYSRWKPSPMVHIGYFLYHSILFRTSSMAWKDQCVPFCTQWKITAMPLPCIKTLTGPY